MIKGCLSNMMKGCFIIVFVVLGGFLVLYGLANMIAGYPSNGTVPLVLGSVGILIAVIQFLMETKRKRRRQRNIERMNREEQEKQEQEREKRQLALRALFMFLEENWR